jgi:hypothetical protein
MTHSPVGGVTVTVRNQSPEHQLTDELGGVTARIIASA